MHREGVDFGIKASPLKTRYRSNVEISQSILGR